MKRLNPIYLLSFAIVLTVYAAFSVHQERIRLKTAQNQYDKAKDLARKLRSIQNAYGVKKKIYLLRTLRSNRSLYAKLKVKEKKKSLKIEAASLPVREALFLLSKIFNGTYNIVDLAFRKEGKGNVALSLEIRW